MTTSPSRSLRRSATLVVAGAALLPPSAASAATSPAPTIQADVADRTVNRVESRLRRGRYLVASLYAPLTQAGRPDVLRGLVAATRVR